MVREYDQGGESVRKHLAILGLLGMLPWEAYAQRHGVVRFPSPGMGGGSGHGSILAGQSRLGPFQTPALGAPEVSLPAVAPIPPFGAPTVQAIPRRIFGPRPSGFLFPFFLPWVPQVVAPYAYPAPSTVVIVQQAPPEPPQPPRAEPPKSVMHEYRLTEPQSAEEKPAAFVLVLTDGSVESAVAVWVYAGAVNWIDASGRRRSAPLERVDRERTLRLNRERGLRLALPGAEPDPRQRRRETP